MFTWYNAKPKRSWQSACLNMEIWNYIGIPRNFCVQKNYVCVYPYDWFYYEGIAIIIAKLSLIFISGSPIRRLSSEWVIDWLSESLSEWVTEWVSDWVTGSALSSHNRSLYSLFLWIKTLVPYYRSAVVKLDL